MAETTTTKKKIKMNQFVNSLQAIKVYFTQVLPNSALTRSWNRMTTSAQESMDHVNDVDRSAAQLLYSLESDTKTPQVNNNDTITTNNIRIPRNLMRTRTEFRFRETPIIRYRVSLPIEARTSNIFTHEEKKLINQESKRYRLQRVQFDEKKHESTECFICRSEFLDKETILRTTCCTGNFMHTLCVVDSIQSTNSKCPFCRQTICI